METGSLHSFYPSCHVWLREEAKIQVSAIRSRRMELYGLYLSDLRRDFTLCELRLGIKDPEAARCQPVEHRMKSWLTLTLIEPES